MKSFKYLSLAIVLALYGCASTYITSSWKAKNTTARQYDKILVIGIMADTSRDLRQNMEKDLVADLKTKGINATSAFDEYGPKAFKRLNEEQVKQKIKDKGYDGVITISLLNKKREKYYVPGYIDYTPFGYGYGFFWDYYSGLYDRVYEPGYYATGTNYLWESNLYDLNTGKLVYSVQSKSFNPYSAQALGRVYGKNIVRDLVKNGIIEKQGK